MRFIFSLMILLGAANILHAQEHASHLNSFFSAYVNDDRLVDYGRIDKSEVALINEILATTDLSSLSTADKIAFYIDAYNFTVIASVMGRYPNIKSVESFSNFFKSPHTIAGESISLDAIEKRLLTMHEKGAVHMVLNCGAKSCPPLYTKAFSQGNLKLNINNAVKQALASKQVIDISGQSISTIFQWYRDDFEPTVKSWLGRHGIAIMDNYTYIDYDWTLNDGSKHPTTFLSKTPLASPTNRYYASNLYSKGSYEISSFNNYYAQVDGEDGSKYQSDWFTSTWTALYGINKRLNIGLDLRLRSTQVGVPEELATLGALNFPISEHITNANGETIRSTRSGLAAVGLRIKYQPIKEIRNLTFQHLIYVPTIGSGNTFLDWESLYILSDAYYDQTLGNNGAIFVSGGLHIENMNAAFFQSGDGYYQMSVPFTAIYSYFPTEKTTLYALANIAPRYGLNSENANTATSWDPYAQLGAGIKYFVTDDFQAEILYTKFFTNMEHRTAATYNLGLRYYGW